MKSTGTAKKRTALVTGANRGLGLETAKTLAREGFRVLLASRNLREGEHAALLLTKQGLDVHAVALDVGAEASVAALATQLTREETRLDVLVNNAGVSLKGFDLEVVERTLAVNFFGALRMTDALGPSLVEHANVVMVSSGLGEVASLSPALQKAFLDPSLTRERLITLVDAFARAVERGRHEDEGWPTSAYRVSKIALNALVRVLAPSFAARAQRINAVCPGWVRTDMGGPHAARSLEQGAAGIVWAATLDEHGANGGFFRDRHAIAW